MNSVRGGGLRSVNDWGIVSSSGTDPRWSIRHKPYLCSTLMLGRIRWEAGFGAVNEKPSSFILLPTREVMSLASESRIVIASSPKDDCRESRNPRTGLRDAEAEK